MNETEQFWAGEFGNAYNVRSPGNVKANYHFFLRALESVRHRLESVVELGAGTGANLRALRMLKPTLKLAGVEINREACKHLDGVADRIIHGSVLDELTEQSWTMSMTKGLLIHINPEDLPAVYATLYAAARRYIFIAEYHNPTPVEVPYRGHAGRLWKRDFAADLMDLYPLLRVVDYGFAWRRDPEASQDDLTWFLFEKPYEEKQCSDAVAA